MKRAGVDLSIYLENDVISDPTPFGRIQYHKHERARSPAFPASGRRPAGRPGLGGRTAICRRTAAPLGAPYHFHPTMNKGERKITIDGVPLEWCFQPGVSSTSARWRTAVITAKEVEDELFRIGRAAAARDRRRRHARAALRRRRREFGLRRRRHHVPARKGVRLTGTDAWSWTRRSAAAQKWARDHDPVVIWEALAGRDIGYCHLEAAQSRGAAHGWLHHRLLPQGRGASAGWTRAVAMYRSKHGRRQANAVIPA
jgi:hypothetical protein